MAAAEDVLTQLGFEKWDEYKAFAQAYANDASTGDGDLSHNGEFVVNGAWRKGDVTVHLERNTSPEDQGDDIEATVKHPPVFVVAKGDQRLATIMHRDPEALKAVLSDLG